MKVKEIYIVEVIYRSNGNTTVSQECYDTQEKAIEFCKSRLNKEELELTEKAQKRGLANWYEFFGKNYDYKIKVLSLK